MTSYVLDASVAIAWYLTESFSVEARAWQTKLLRDEATLYVPGLHFWEFANVLRTYVRRAELEEPLAAETFDLHVTAPLVVSEPDRRRVLPCALEYGATAYDAVYIALSLSLDAPLITAEKTTTPWVVKLGEKVRTVAGPKR
jgi:predicted nucleic acid-binding protein